MPILRYCRARPPPPPPRAWQPARRHGGPGGTRGALGGGCLRKELRDSCQHLLASHARRDGGNHACTEGRSRDALRLLARDVEQGC